MMRTTLDIPEELIDEAMQITNAKTKTAVIKIALENIVRQEQYSKLLNYHGKIDIEVDLNSLRNR